MVGSVLLDGIRREGGMEGMDPYFFTTSQTGQLGPSLLGEDARPLLSAYDTDELGKMDIIVSCQGGDYSKDVYPKLKAAGWNQYWIDAASAFRMDDDSLIVLDPVNGPQIEAAIQAGTKKFVGGNCTVSLMLMATAALFKEGLVEAVSAMTYQAASGGGARHMKEFLAQMGELGDVYRSHKDAPILDLDGRITQKLNDGTLDTSCFKAPLAANILPWIDSQVDDGQTREEWKADAEGNKILGGPKRIPFDGICVRVGALRCHSQALTIKLNREIAPSEVEDLLRQSHEWIKVVPNQPEATLRDLTPAAVTGTSTIAVGRIRNSLWGKDYISMFTVGDQLLWGAAEPLRRTILILKKYLTGGSERSRAHYLS